MSSRPLRLQTVQYKSADATETYTLRDGLTPVGTLTAGGSGLVGIFGDLGAGAIFGSPVYASLTKTRSATSRSMPRPLRPSRSPWAATLRLVAT
jgi:hypothetical protein